MSGDSDHGGQHEGTMMAHDLAGLPANRMTAPPEQLEPMAALAAAMRGHAAGAGSATQAVWARCGGRIMPARRIEHLLQGYPVLLAVAIEDMLDVLGGPERVYRTRHAAPSPEVVAMNAARVVRGWNQPIRPLPPATHTALLAWLRRLTVLAEEARGIGEQCGRVSIPKRAAGVVTACRKIEAALVRDSVRSEEAGS